MLQKPTDPVKSSKTYTREGYLYLLEKSNFFSYIVLIHRARVVYATICLFDRLLWAILLAILCMLFSYAGSRIFSVAGIGNCEKLGENRNLTANPTFIQILRFNKFIVDLDPVSAKFIFGSGICKAVGSVYFSTMRRDFRIVGFAMFELVACGSESTCVDFLIFEIFLLRVLIGLYGDLRGRNWFQIVKMFNLRFVSM